MLPGFGCFHLKVLLAFETDGPAMHFVTYEIMKNLKSVSLLSFDESFKFNGICNICFSLLPPFGPAQRFAMLTQQALLNPFLNPSSHADLWQQCSFKQ